MVKAKSRFYSVTGNGYNKIYKEDYDKKGVRSLVVSGKTCTYDKIQSYAEDVKIERIVARYLGGDISVLDKNKGFYTDITQIPRNFNDFHNKIVQGQNLWNGLPTDFKAMFGNDLNRFISDIYDGDFENKLGKYNELKNPKKIVSDSVKEVSNEQETK